MSKPTSPLASYRASEFIFVVFILLLNIFRGWMIGGSSPGREWEFFSSQQCPEQHWDPPSLLSNRYQ